MTRLLLMLALIAAPAAVCQDKPNFSGTWSLDLQMTRFNGVEPPKALVLKIDHQEPLIRIATETETKAGMTTESFQLATDGTTGECEVGGHPVVAAAHWDQWTGERLVWTVKRNTADGQVEISRRAKLGDKGKILTTVATIKTPAGERKYYEFFVRK
jgi:hypothetical protein